MAKKKGKNDKAKKKPQVHEDLEGFEIKIDEFGQIKSTMNRDKLNDFLNKNVEDKKFKDRDDLDFLEADEAGNEEEADLDIDPNDLPESEDLPVDREEDKEQDD